MSVPSSKLFSKSRHLAGVTLMELLVAVAIIAVLVAILFPLARSSMLAAKKTQSLQNLRSLGSGFSFFQMEQQGQFPGYGVGSSSRWLHQISPYLGNKANWQVSTDNMKPFPVDTHAYGRPIFHSPLTPKASYTQPSVNSIGMYGYNRNLRGDAFLSPYRIQQIQRPASLAVLASKYYLGGGPTLEVDGPYPENPAGVAANYQVDGPKPDGTGPALYLFADGHVEVMSVWPGKEAFDPEHQL